MTSSFTLLLAVCLAGVDHDPQPCQLQPGDILLFQSVGCFKNLLYGFGHSGGATHSGIVVARPDGTLGILEAPGPIYPVMISDIASRFQYYNGRIWLRSRKAPLSVEQSRCLTTFACEQEGKKFATLGVLAPVFGHPVRKCTPRCLDESQLVDRSRWFCSELVAVALVQAGQLDPCWIRPKFTDPQDLKSDRLLDLSSCYGPPVPIKRCGERNSTWISITCDGLKQCWE